MRRVVIESPYAGDTARNTAYARRALLHSLQNGEAPVASHLLHTQVLDDSDPQQRRTGLCAGWAWYERAETCAVYADYGFTPGMQAGIAEAEKKGVPVEIRYIGHNPGKQAGGQLGGRGFKVLDFWTSGGESFRLVSLGVGPDILQVMRDDGAWVNESAHFVHGVLCERIAAAAAAGTAGLERIAAHIHYPECWDTAAYPELADAVCEITRCDPAQCTHGSGPDAAAAPLSDCCGAPLIFEGTDPVCARCREHCGGESEAREDRDGEGV